MVVKTCASSSATSYAYAFLIGITTHYIHGLHRAPFPYEAQQREGEVKGRHPPVVALLLFFLHIVVDAEDGSLNCTAVQVAVYTGQQDRADDGSERTQTPG